MIRQLLAGTALAAGIAGFPAGAVAQDQAEPVIVVSAKNPGADPFAQPASVVALDGAALEARSFRDLSHLSYAAPNVSLDPIGTFRGVANFAIRGLGVNSSIPSIDPAVGLFVDGVYMGINAGTVLDALDVARVEILRGPQGVGFGRNTTGGAVLVATADPAWEWEGAGRFSLDGPVDGGRGGMATSLSGHVSGPLSDHLALRIAGLRADDQGYFENRFDGSNIGGSATTMLRGGLEYRSGPVRLLAKGEWAESDGTGAPTHSNGQLGRGNFAVNVNQRGFHRSDSHFATLRAELDVGGGRLTNIFGWREYALATRNDIDSTPVKLFESDTATAQEQFSNELFYEIAAEGWALTAGGYWFEQETGYDEGRDLTGLGGTFLYGGGVQDHRVLGLYAQANIDLAPTLTLTAGLRWSDEEKAADVTFVRARAACSAIAASCPVAGERVAGEPNGFSDARSWSGLSPKLALNWWATSDASLYASWTRGHRSGGYNLRITQPQAFEQIAAAQGSRAFDAERVDSFELGGKWRADNGRARASVALFWSEVDNLQRELNVPSQSSGLAQSVYNTADARIRGAEAEASVEPLAGLVLGAAAGVTDAEYRRVFLDLTGDNAITAADLALDLPRAPQWTLGGSVEHRAELGDGLVLESAAFFQHRARFAYTDNNWGYNDAADMLDASVALHWEDRGLTLRLYARNLLDEVQFGGDTQLPFGGGAFSDGNNRPYDPAPAAGTFSPLLKGRVLGAEVAARF